jgi:G3E family GTPase
MPSVTFRYLLNGNTVTFTQQVDIDSMKGHPEYVLVEDTPVATPAAPAEAPKKAGRPAKVVAEVA